jgi:S1-C subfamily serine protease
VAADAPVEAPVRAEAPAPARPLAAPAADPPAERPPDAPRPAEPAPRPAERLPQLLEPPAARPPEKAERPAERVPEPGGERAPARLTPEARDKVKRATVFLRVTMPDGKRASGSGFFGVPEAPNLVLTNAHVVGMLDPDGRKPRAVDVVVNSGEADSRRIPARVLGVDRHSDLAVLDVGAANRGLAPAPLTVKSADALRELDDVWVFGFPLGESLGPEITIRPASVSSLRKRNGVLDKIQVNGGMDPGNSGGPVVDSTGAVIGVAVSGIPGRQINFAIPGQKAHAFLSGRLSAMVTGQPYLANNRLGVPVTLEMIDPREQVREAALEVWTGDRGAAPPAGTDPPGPRPGDSPHTRVRLEYAQGEARGEVELPQAPAGKVYWLQPVYVSGGTTHWAEARPLDPTKLAPVERKPAHLALRFPAGATHLVTLTTKGTYRVGRDDDGDAFVLTGRAKLAEQVMGSDASGPGLRLTYKEASRELLAGKGPPKQPRDFDQLRPLLLKSFMTLRLDPQGNPTKSALERPRSAGTLAGALGEFHEPNQYALEVAAVPLPGKEAEPGFQWTATRTFPVDTPGGFRKGEAELTYTYRGQRPGGGRREAVIGIEGVLGGKEGAAGPSGRITGTAVVDLAAGVVTQFEAQTSFDVQFRVNGSDGAPHSVKVLATIEINLTRGL